jgi:hypothetical protein
MNNLIIANNGITVDSASHSLTGTAVQVASKWRRPGRSCSTVKNLGINFSYGIYQRRF